MTKGKIKKALSILLTVLALTLAAGAVFAYYEAVDSGWGQQITLTNVNFKLNGNGVGSTVASTDLGGFSRGEHKDVKLELTAVATAAVNTEAEYSVSFSLDGESLLAAAVEVYVLNGEKYEYRCRLSQINGLKLQGSVPIERGVNQNNTEEYLLRLVYSATAGDYYEDKSFSLKAEATFEISKNYGGNYYVRSFADLSDAASDVNAKNIVFLSDVTLLSDVKFTRKVNIELNGYSLNLGSRNFSIDYVGTGIKAGIFDKTGLASVVNGKITVNCPADVYYVQDSLADSVEIADFDIYALKKAMAIQTSVAENKFLSENETFNIARDLAAYLRSPLITQSFDGGLFTLCDYSDGLFTVKSGAAFELTRIYSGLISIEKGGDAVGIPVNARILGTGAYSAAEEALSSVPDTVYGAVFLPAAGFYGTTFSWESSSSALLDSDGRYLAYGMDALPSWQKQNVEIGVIANAGGQQYRMSKKVTVNVADAAKRTDLVYSFVQPVLEKENEVIDFASKYLADSDSNVKAGIAEIRIEFKDASQNQDKSGNSYVEISYKDKMPSLTLVRQPTGSPAKIELLITFVYSDGADKIEYTLVKTLVAVNYTADNDLKDASGNMQKALSNNAYVNGTGLFDFDIEGNNGEYHIEFFTDSDYLLIANNRYVKNEAGNFALQNGEYIYFDARYDMIAEGVYEIAKNGEYVFLNDVYVTYDSVKNDIYFERADFKVVPAKVPPYDTLTKVGARLFTYVNGNKIYAADENGNVLEYALELSTFGIYHNNDAEIADGNVYNVLLSYFDLNGNGWIEISEAEAEWLKSDGTSNLLKPLATNFYSSSFIDLASSDIRTLKGLEYFTGALGYDLSKNSVTSLTPLSNLYSLIYLNLDSNLLTSVESLAYLDKLEYLGLARNDVSSVEPLRYLPEVKYLFLSYNDKIQSVDALSGYAALQRLEIVQTADIYTKLPSMLYELLMLKKSSPNAYIYRFSGGWMTPTSDETAAAEAMSRVAAVDDVYTSLYVPSKYAYRYTQGSSTYEKIYDLRWSLTNDEDKTYLEFIYDADGKTFGYVINSPVVNRNIGISLSVREENASGDWVQVSRVFKIQLLKDPAQNVYIEVASGDKRLASSVISDKALLAELFRLYNTDGDNTLSYDEINNPSLKYDLDLSGKGVTSLTGLNYFAAALSGMSANFSQIALNDSDYAEIRALSGLVSITLAGAEYDFEKFLDEKAGIFTSPFTSLKTLYVAGSYSLGEQNVLRGLYRMYLCNKELNIYKDGVTMRWNPYDGILAKEMQSLPSAFSFKYLNQSLTLDGKFKLSFYGINDVVFDISDIRYYSRTSSSAGGVSSSDEYFKSTVTGGILSLNYVKLAAYTDTVYAEVSLLGNDGRTDISYGHYLKLIAEFNNEIRVYDILDGSGNPSPLDKVFASRTLKETVLGKLTSLFNSQASATSISNIGSGYFTDSNAVTYISAATLSALSISSVTIDGTHGDDKQQLKGLKYLAVTELTVERDVYLGDGSELVNIKKLTVYDSGVDFGTLNVSLPNLLELTLGNRGAGKYCRYVSLYEGNDYFLSKLPSLQVFSAVDCRISDWEGLKGLIGNDNFKELYIYGTASGYSNLNSNYMSTVNIVKLIYGEAANDSKKFYIGGVLNAADSSFRYEGVWAGGTVTDISPEANETYRQFGSLVPDLGLKMNYGSGDRLYFNDRNDTVNAGDTVVLPMSLSDYMFGASYSEAGKYFEGSFAIEWRIAGVGNGSGNKGSDLSELNGIFALPDSAAFTGTIKQLSSSTNYYSYYDLPTASIGSGEFRLTVKARPYDFYLLLVGSIGEGYWQYDETTSNYAYRTLDSQTRYAFVYPILIKGANPSASDRVSYSIFEDPGLRMKMYYVYSWAKSASSLDVTNGCINSNSLSMTHQNRITGVTLGETSVGYDGGGNAGNRSYNTVTIKNGSTCSTTFLQDRIINLNGVNQLKIGNDTPLTKFYATQGTISDISGLSGMSTLTDIDLSGNLITDVSALSGCKQILKLNLSSNAVESLAGADGTCVFKGIGGTDAIMGTDLNIAYNAKISASDIKLLAEGANNIYSLNLYGTAAAGDVETLVQLEQMETKVSRLALKSGTWQSITEAKLTAFLDIVLNRGSATGNTIGKLIDGSLLSDGTPQTISYSGTSYKSTFNSNFNTASAYWGQNAISAAMYVTDGSELFANFTVGFKSTGANYTVNGHSAGEFDSGLWAYLTRNSTLSGYAFSFNAVTVNISADWGITSLKGIEHLTSLSSFTISANALSSLYDAPAAHISSLTVADGRLSSQSVLTALENSPNLQTLNLSKAFGINYYKTLKDGSGADTTLAEFIADKTKLTSLTSLSVNAYDYRFATYGAESFYENYLAYLNAGSTLFNVAGGKDFRSFGANLLGLLSAYNGFTKNLYAAVSSGYTDYLAAASGVNYVTNAAGSNNLSGWTALLANIAGNRSSLLPNQLSQFDLRTDSGVIFYLPTQATIYGETVYFNWSCTENSAYVDNGVFAVNAANYANDSEINLKLRAEITVNGIAYSFDMSHKFEVLESAAYSESPYNQPNYYIRVRNADGSYSFVNALKILESPNLVYALFAEKASDAVVKEYITGEKKIGYYISAEDVTALNLDDKGVTSLSGIDTFAKLKSLKISKGSIVSLSALSKLRLESFAYDNSSDAASNYGITDFEGLLAGSINTLKEFSYASYANVHPYELSFLTAFKSLIHVYLGISSTGTAFNQYLYSNSMKYLVGYFDINRPEVNILVRSSWTNLPYVTESVRINNVNYLRLHADGATKAAVKVLQSYKGGGDVSLYDGYGMKVNGVSGTTDTTEFYLPGYIEFGGELYALSYYSQSSDLTVADKYELSLARETKFVFTDGTTATYTDQSLLSYEEFKKVIETDEFARLRFAKAADFRIKLGLINQRYSTQTRLPLTLRTNVNGYDYERTVSLNAFA